MKKGIDFIGVGVVCLCHDGNKRYLLGLRSDQCRDEHFKWDPIGSGGIKHGETIEDAVRREVLEEVGTSPLDLERIGMRETFRELDGQKYHWIQFDYLVRIDPNQVSNPEPEKCLEMRWCSIDEFPEEKDLHSQFPKFLNTYKEIL
ncbi:NUDIX hydrolase [Candidatus Kaiserbacteria bacterium]|nr:NUDIX hydrolase [Candidatus Kaiserbacteria bacterium]MCB9811760.1 NUDIX hydrolase [Candidatus Nomurabacteria bacterium]